MSDRLTALEELLREKLTESSINVLDSNFMLQTNFINDDAKLKALFCTRRSAKSYTAGLYLVQTCLDFPGVNCLFIGLTRESARGILWKDILKIIDDKHNLDIEFNESRLTATFPNGSVIWLAGCDTDEDEMNKLLGKKYKLITLDEASMFTIDLNRLIYGVLKPAVADQRGTICLLGTSSNITRSLFKDITEDKEPGWKLFKWTAYDNPYVAKQWAEEIADIDRDRPLFKKTTLYRQWYLNEWCVDDTKLVYRFQSPTNVYKSLPHFQQGDWSFVLGVDLGYNDDTAISVVAFHEFDKCLYIIETFKQPNMDITDVANKIKFFQKQYPAYKVVIDGSNKMAVEEMRKRHDLGLVAADKTGKSDFIEIMNAEFIQANIKLNEATTKELQEEYNTLVWITEGDKVKLPRKEHPACANHIADATLYAWRYTYPFLAKPVPKPVNVKDPAQWIKHTEKLMEENLQRQIDQQEADENNNDIFAIQSMDPFNDDNPMQHYLNKKRGKL